MRHAQTYSRWAVVARGLLIFSLLGLTAQQFGITIPEASRQRATEILQP